MAEDIGIHTEHQAAHHRGLMASLRDIPHWGWWAMGGAALLLILWYMHRSHASNVVGSSPSVDTGQTAIAPTDPNAAAGGTSSGSPDTTQALLDGIQQMQASEMDALNQMMQGQSQAIGAALDASSQQQMAALQGLNDTVSSLGDVMTNVLSAVQGLSHNPIVSNPGTTGAGNPGPGYPVAPGVGGGPDPSTGIIAPPSVPAPYTGGNAADWAQFGYVWDADQGKYVPGTASSVQAAQQTQTPLPEHRVGMGMDVPVNSAAGFRNLAHVP